ncbi:hypothetical protein FE257_004955 [Aspergillus nanangensis]|uniref:Uncharacterized protein n=1 Tax=Aspergillus nanangensis TaxID=2582783 RepID=A0AAD4CBJ9_ASPNN|nr:hypothetical protein FE257_004955 [Aspergillus nanangensis]
MEDISEILSRVTIAPQISDTFEQLFQKIVTYAGELRNHRIPDEEIEGTRQLAGPFTRGGLLILLIEPLAHHPWQAGIDHVIIDCHDISVLDLRPFIWSGLRNKLQEDQLVQLHDLVFEAIRAKRPDTILCMGAKKRT